MSHHSLRGQIMAYCNSLRVLLDGFPTIRDTFFMVGQANEKKGLKDSGGEVKADSRYARLLMLVTPPKPAVPQRGALSTELWSCQAGVCAVGKLWSSLEVGFRERLLGH